MAVDKHSNIPHYDYSILSRAVSVSFLCVCAQERESTCVCGAVFKAPFSPCTTRQTRQSSWAKSRILLRSAGGDGAVAMVALDMVAVKKSW